MEQLRNIIAIERDGLNVRTLNIQLIIYDPNLDIRQAVVDACTEYVQTPEGKQTYIGNCHCFNWADFEAYVPNEICKKHGFCKYESQLSDIEVNWDEELVNESALDLDE